MEEKFQPEGRTPFILMLESMRKQNLRLAAEARERSEAEEARRILVANIPGAVYRCEVEAPWRMSFCSEGFLALTGRQPADFLERGLTYSEIIHPEDLDRVEREVALGVVEHRAFQLSYRIVLPDGALRWVLERGQAYSGVDGRPQWLDGVILDISPQKLAEAALAEKEERLRLVLEATGVGFWDRDLASGAMLISERCAEILGYRSEELLPCVETWPGLIHPEDLPQVRGRVRAHLSGQTPSYLCEYRMRHKAGHWVWVQARGAVVARDAEGKPLRFTGSYVDISERRAAQEALELSQASFSAMFRLSQAAMALSTWPEARHLDVNEAWTDLTGISRAEALGRSAEELGLFVDSEQREDSFIHLAKDGRFQDRELLLRRRDGGVRTVIWSARLFDLGGARYRVSSAVDITDSKRAAEALLDSERRLRILFEGSPIGIFRSTPEGRFLQVNPALAAIFRYADPGAMVEEVNRLGIPAALYEIPDQRSALVKHLLAQQGNWVVEEVHFRRRDGTFMDGIMSITLNPDPGTGQPLLFGFVQDISARKVAEDALRAKTALLEAQTNATLDGILVVTEGQKRSLINRRMIEMFAVPPHVLADEDDASLLDHVVGLTKYPDRFLAQVRHLYAHPDETSRDEIEFKSGMVLERYSAPVPGGNGKGYGRIWTFRDITERKRAEQEILQLKNYMSSVIDSMPAMLAALDETGRVIQWNRGAEAMLDLPASEARGRFIEEVAKDFAPWISALRQEISRERRPASMEKLFLPRRGERCFFELMLYPLTADGAEGTVVRIQDITERVRIQDLMIQTEKMMSVGGLAAGMAHEINNPLGIISQAAQNIERRLSADLPGNRAAADELGLDLGLIHAYFDKRQIPQFLGGIQEAVTRATRIVGNMLQFSRQADSTRHPASLVELLEQALGLAANDYDLKKKSNFHRIEVLREFDARLPMAPVVAIEIEQVFLNLLKNATQAMGANPPEKPPRLILRARCEGRHAVVEIEDNGPGMDEAIRRRVFEPFFTTKEPGVGTGLGLSVSYTIITQNHKGLMEVVSTPGCGARFTVRLPLMRETDDTPNQSGFRSMP